MKYSEPGEIDQDLSQISDPLQFQRQLTDVSKESYRVLKQEGRLVLCMGDNRNDMVYVPVGFQTLRTYIDCGFELEEYSIRSL